MEQVERLESVSSQCDVEKEIPHKFPAKRALCASRCELVCIM